MTVLIPSTVSNFVMCCSGGAGGGGGVRGGQGLGPRNDVLTTCKAIH